MARSKIKKFSEIFAFLSRIFSLIFQIICIKINKHWNIIEKIREKCKSLRKLYNFRVGHKFLIMWKIKNLTWTCYNWGLGGGVPECRKMFRKIIEIDNVKFNNFSKIAWIFCTEQDKNRRIIENFIRPAGSWAEPPYASEFLLIFPKFSSCNLFFLKLLGSALRQKIIIQYFPCFHAS